MGVAAKKVNQNLPNSGLFEIGKGNLALRRNDVDCHIFVDDIDDLGRRIGHSDMLEVFGE